MLREQQKPFLVTGWAKIPACASPLERSDEWTEIFMAAVCIFAFNPCDTFRVVPTFNETFHCLLDVDDPVFAILICIMIVVVLLKIREVVFILYIFALFIFYFSIQSLEQLKFK